MVRNIRYEVRESDGTIAAIHERIEYDDGGKNFHWRGPDGTPGLQGRKAATLPLYGVHDMDHEADYAVIVEGERCVDALRSVGINAIGTVTGANGPIPCDDSLKAVRDFQAIYLWADYDEPGHRHMRQVGDRLKELGHLVVRGIVWVDAPAKGDAADFIEMGRVNADVLACMEAAEAVSAQGVSFGEEVASLHDDNSSSFYETVDVMGLLTNDDDADPLIEGIIYPGKMTLVGAYAGVGKTTLSMELIAARIKQQRALGLLDVVPLTGPVAYFSELSPASLRDALDTLEAVNQIPPETIAKHLRVYRLSSVPAADPRATAEFLRKCSGSDTVIIDTFDDWLGDNPNQTDTALAGWQILRRIAATGTAVLVFDHSGKTVVGYDDKMSAVAGSSGKLRLPDLVFSMKAEETPDRHNILKPVKERIDGVSLELRLLPNGQLVASELVKDEADRGAVQNAKRFIITVVAESGELTFKDIVRKGLHAGHSKAAVKRALRDMKLKGEIHQPGRGRYNLGSLPNPVGSSESVPIR